MTDHLDGIDDPPTPQEPDPEQELTAGSRKRGRPRRAHRAMKTPAAPVDFEALASFLQQVRLPPPSDPLPAGSASGMAPTAEQWMQMMEVLRTNKVADEEIAATIHAKAMKKALHPENEIAPAISVYNPRGETQYPREKPTHIYLIGPYPICDPGNYDTTTATELALLNQVLPGLYPVTKADGTTVKILVKSEADGAGKPYRTVLFADGKGIMDDEQKNNWGSLLQILTEIVTGEGPAASFERYQREINDLKTQLAAAAA